MVLLLLHFLLFKGHVFLDVIAPDEYFAMALHPTRPGLLVVGFPLCTRIEDVM